MKDAITKARAYSRTKHYVAIINISVYLLFFSFIQFSGLSSSILAFLLPIFPYYYLTITVYISILGILLELISFPLAYYGSFDIEHKYGLCRQNFFSWFKDYFKETTISSFLCLIIVNTIYYFLRASPGLWWLFTALFYLFLSLIIAKIFPIIVIPLFYKLNKLPGSPLRQRLIQLADKAGVKVIDIYNIALGEKTKKANAALCGWGATRRILLSDTLLDKYGDDEIESTLAHELAHYKCRHFWKLNFFNFVITLIGFYIVHTVLIIIKKRYCMAPMLDIAIFPFMVLLFIIYCIITTPVLNFISRLYESEADMVAISLTENPVAFSNLIRKLSIQNLSDPNPPILIKIFFYDHPPVNERIDSCNSQAKKYMK